MYKKQIFLQFIFCLICVKLISGNHRLIFQSCQTLGWNCDNDIPHNVSYTCDVGNKTDIHVHIGDYFYDSIVSLRIANCRSVQVQFGSGTTRNYISLKELCIVNSLRVEFPIDKSASSRYIPSNVSFVNIGTIVRIPEKIFNDPDIDPQGGYIRNIASNKILFKNITIEEIDHNAFFNFSKLNTFVFDNVTVNKIKERAINIIMEDNGLFSINNAIINILSSNAINVKCYKFQFRHNSVDQLHPNGLNVTSENIIVSQNYFKLLKSDAFGFFTNSAEIAYNDFDLIKTSAFMNIKPKDTKPTQFTFSYNKVQNLEIGSLYFDKSTFELPDNVLKIEHNLISCVCRRTAWLYFYPYLGDAFNSVAELNDRLLSTSNNNTCLNAPCYLPLSIIKILIVNNMCHLHVETRLMCYLYYDKTINKITSDDLRMNTNYKPNIDLEKSENYALNLDVTESNVTEPAPAFYIVKSQLRDNSSSVDNVKQQDDNTTQYSDADSTNLEHEVMQDNPVDLVSYLKNHNFPNITIDKMLATNNPNSPARVDKNQLMERNNFQSFAKCYDKESCSKHIQENKRKALDFYKYLYSQIRPEKYNPPVEP